MKHPILVEIGSKYYAVYCTSMMAWVSTSSTCDYIQWVIYRTFWCLFSFNNEALLFGNVFAITFFCLSNVIRFAIWWQLYDGTTVPSFNFFLLLISVILFRYWHFYGTIQYPKVISYICWCCLDAPSTISRCTQSWMPVICRKWSILTYPICIWHPFWVWPCSNLAEIFDFRKL